MKNRLFISIMLTAVMYLFSGCTNDSDDVTLVISWTFSSGDCISNGVVTVKVAVTPTGGSALTGEAACTAGQVDLGSVAGGGYSALVQGLDAGGIVRTENYGNSFTVAAGMGSRDVPVTMHPKAPNVNVTWNGCPFQVTLPYFITIYNPPATPGGPLTDDVTMVQEGCASSAATLLHVEPGSYVIELDSRADPPKIYSTQSLTVLAGEDATVHFDVP